MAAYPGAIKSFTTKVNLVDTINADHINDLQSEIAAIETELGINPPDVDDSVNAVSGAANLALRLDHLANIIKSVSGAANWYTDPTTSVNQLETDVNAIEAVYIPDTLVDAKGDLIIGSADDTVIRKAVGGDNRMLRALAGGTGGVEWDKRQYVQMTVVEYTTDIATGDGQAYLHVPAHLAGLDLVEVHAEVITAGTTSSILLIHIYNVTEDVDMLETGITVDLTETGSDTADAPAVIDEEEDDVAENDLLRVDVDTISGVAPKGLIVTLGFA